MPRKPGQTSCAYCRKSFPTPTDGKQLHVCPHCARRVRLTPEGSYPAQRDWGTGTIVEKANGTFEYQKAHKGIRYTGTGPTYPEAEAELDAVLAALAKGKSPHDRNPTLNVLMRRWLKEIIEPHLSPHTHEFHRNHTERHILPDLGETKILDLERDEIQAFYNRLQKVISKKSGKPLRSTTIRAIHSTFHLFLEQAITWHYLKDNPADHTKRKKVTRTKYKHYSAEEASRFLEAARRDPYYLAFMLPLHLAWRRSEVLGLQWSDFDEEMFALSLEEAVNHTWKIHVPGTKTEGSEGYQELPAVLVPLVRHHRADQLERILADGGRGKWEGEDYVFIGPKGKQLGLGTLYRRFRGAIRSAGLNPIRYHDLRHSLAKNFLLDRVPVPVVSGMLRHSSPATTMRAYADVMKEDMAGWSDHMETLLSRPRKRGRLQNELQKDLWEKEDFTPEE